MFEDIAYEDLGHRLDFEVIELELYRLISHVLADKAIAEHAANDPERKWMGPDGRPTNALEALQSRFRSTETSRLALFVAISIRNLDDRAKDKKGRSVFDKYMEGICGYCKQQDGTEYPLSLRRACNKIIHASYVNFDHDSIKGGSTCDELVSLPPCFVHPIYRLSSDIDESTGERLWEAKVDLIKFADLVIKCLKFHRAQEAESLDR